MPLTTTRRECPRSPKHRRTNITKQHKLTIPEKSTENTDLTRFGLDAYVLGARKGEGFIDFNKSITLTAMGIGKVLPLLYSPPQLHTKPLFQILTLENTTAL